MGKYCGFRSIPGQFVRTAFPASLHSRDWCAPLPPAAGRRRLRSPPQGFKIIGSHSDSYGLIVTNNDQS